MMDILEPSLLRPLLQMHTDGIGTAHLPTCFLEELVEADDAAVFVEGVVFRVVD